MSNEGPATGSMVIARRSAAPASVRETVGTTVAVAIRSSFSSSAETSLGMRARVSRVTPFSSTHRRATAAGA